MRDFTLLMKVVAFVALLPTATLAVTWNVLPGGSGDWPTIQAALDTAAAGDTVLLGCGTFHEHDIVLVSGVVVCSETGDPACASIDADDQGRVFVAQDVQGVVLEGISFTGGRAESTEYPGFYGGAVYCGDSEVDIRNCVFADSYGSSGGGGLGFVLSTLHVQDCSFLSNSTGHGGGALLIHGSLLMERCDLRGNQGYDGGAVHHIGLEGENVVFRDCVFADNVAYWTGGAVFSTSMSVPFFQNCTFSANSAANRGGAIYCINYGEARLLNCTLSDNRCDNGAGGVECWAYGVAELENTILAFSTQGPAVFCNVAGSVMLTCSDVFGNAGGDWTGCIASQAGANGNFSADPRFCDRIGGDYTLESGSPCLDAPGCGLVGALGQGCEGSTAIEETTWGGVKRIFR